MAYADGNRRGRIGAAAIAGAIQALLLYGLLSGLSFGGAVVGQAPENLTLFAIVPPPPARTVPRRRTTHRREGAAAPRNLRAQATAVVAPRALVPVPVPPTIVTTPVAGVGAEASQGASDLPGPGTGSGGIGAGHGGGARGDGDGDETPPRWKKGRIKDSDYPKAAAEAGAGGIVSVRYRIEIDGRVTGCVITRSSGNAVLDETTCRLIEQRFRYEPSRDARGRPVIAYIVRDNEWIIQRVPPDPR